MMTANMASGCACIERAVAMIMLRLMKSNPYRYQSLVLATICRLLGVGQLGAVGYCCVPH